jgi:hypothetical protein
MNIRSLSLKKSQDRYNAMVQSGRFEPDATLPDELAQLRRRVRDAIAAADPKGPYQHDLAMGLALYQTLPWAGIGVRDAADAAKWRFLSLDVFPDLVFLRTQASEARFYSSRRRLWLRRCWWYIHLTWQGSEAATRRALGAMSTDTVAQLVERPGPGGFRVELWRAIAARFEDARPPEGAVRRLMKTNTALLVVVEPSLSLGGVGGYVDRLYSTLTAGAPTSMAQAKGPS